METQAGVIEQVNREDHRCTSPHRDGHAHMKNVKRGTERMDRHPAPGTAVLPKKSGKGGKYTWEGPEPPTNYTEEEAPVALDEKDPNYIDEAQEEEDLKVAAGVVDVAKMAPHDIAVVNVVLPPENK